MNKKRPKLSEFPELLKTVRTNDTKKRKDRAETITMEAWQAAIGEMGKKLAGCNRAVKYWDKRAKKDMGRVR